MIILTRLQYSGGNSVQAEGTKCDLINCLWIWGNVRAQWGLALLYRTHYIFQVHRYLYVQHIPLIKSPIWRFGLTTVDCSCSSHFGSVLYSTSTLCVISTWLFRTPTCGLKAPFSLFTFPSPSPIHSWHIVALSSITKFRGFTRTRVS